MRAVLANDCTAYFFNYYEKSVQQKRRMVTSFHGETRLGKSTNGITMHCYGRDWFRDYVGVTPQLVYCQSLAEVSNLVKEAEATDNVYLNQQDEDSVIGGPGSRSTIDDYANCITNLAFKRHWFSICNPDPPVTVRSLCDFAVKVIGYDPKMGTGTTSNMLFYPDGSEQGVVFIEKYRFPNEFGDRNEYEFYETEVKPKHQHEISMSGGYVGATTLTTELEKARRLAEMMIKLKPKQEVFTDGLFGSAAIECKERVHTKGDQRNHLKLKTEAVFNELIEKRRKEALQAPPELVPQPDPSITSMKDRRMDKNAASTYSKRGHEAENSCWDQVIPQIRSIDSTAMFARVGGYGKEDGIIEFRGTSYVSDSKDYTVPLDENVDYVENKKINGCFTRYKAEKDRGNQHVEVLIIYHEVNRNTWIVKLVENPLRLMSQVDKRGRAYGSQRLNLSDGCSSLVEAWKKAIP
jgi:hypothetical protein